MVPFNELRLADFLNGKEQRAKAQANEQSNENRANVWFRFVHHLLSNAAATSVPHNGFGG
jgi:hypothetical protein